MTPLEPAPSAPRVIPAAALLALAAIALLAPLAAAQGADPTVNESEMDTSVPPGDERYLDDSGEAYANDTGGASDGTGSPSDTSGDPTLAEGDFDVGVPAADESFLDDAYDTGAPAAKQAESAPPPRAQQVPGIPVPGLLAAVAAVAVAAAHASRRSP